MPPGAYEVSYGGGLLYLAYADPYPSLIGLRPVDGLYLLVSMFLRGPSKAGRWPGNRATA